MKTAFRRIPAKLEASFGVRHDIRPRFTGCGHYHPELELHYVIKGEGVRFIGDNISNFSAGEIILLGENLPHSWRSTNKHRSESSEQHIEVIVFNFLPDFFGKQFLSMPEALMISKIFTKAKGGLMFHGNARSHLAQLMVEALNASGLDRIIVLLKILKVIANTNEFDCIAAGSDLFFGSDDSDILRLNSVYDYTFDHYKENIALSEVAALCHLSVTSFCRYFKAATNKTYYDFLIEVRVSQACKLLIEDRLPAKKVCFECGFQNVSNFYRHFKRITEVTPFEYKKKFFSTN